MKKAVVGISGGVDSSVAALLLKERGYNVVGLFMKNWDDSSVTLTSSCTWEDDWFFARMIAKKIDIPIHFVDFSTEYRQRVVDYMFSEYEKGRTPNPDVLCNREVKFDLFTDKAIELGADVVATGHYCRKRILKVGDHEIYQLLAGLDGNKDQSYFLCQLTQKQLERAIFPIGELTKPEVREIAEKNDLATATRKDSQGICFVGKVDLPVFLQQKLEAKKGNIIEIQESFYDSDEFNKRDYSLSAVEHSENDGLLLGKHRGAVFFTIGQRKGLDVGGTGVPLYVIATDVETNTVYVGRGDKHPGLYRKGLRVAEGDIHWIREDLEMKTGEERSYLVRIRYRQPLQKALVRKVVNGIEIYFDVLQRGIAAGQFAAWYNDDELIGSGIIA